MASFFSRDELLDSGLPARRASMLLFAIENRTSQLLEQAHRDTAVYLTLASSPTREQEFFAALARGRSAASVNIQQIERYAPQWQTLLPETPDAKLNAALADLLSKKYKFTRDEIPQLRSALTLEDTLTRQHFERAYGKPLDTIYAPRAGAAERARFAWAHAATRLEALPAFWLAFFLTLPGAAGLLALPIALAGVGLGGGLLLLGAFALLNMFTVAALAEATARSGVTRLGLGWLGQLVQEYLGGAGALFLTIILALNNFFVLVVFFLGVGGTLQDAARVPTAFWMLLLFGVCLFFLSRGSLNATIASTLVIIFVVVLLLVLIPVFALPYFQIGNIARASFISLDFTSLQFALALLLSTYFSHLLVATYAPVVIRKNAGARHWIAGSTAAIFGFMLIAALWFVVLSGALPPEVLARATGTVLTPLAEKAGAIVLWLGSLLVILSLGLATVQIALGLYYMVQERLPAPRADSMWSNARVRFLISIVPLSGVLLLAEYLAFTGESSFASLLGFLSAFTLPLLGGVFPILLLAATRRKGDFVPDGAPGAIGKPLILGLGYVVFVGIIFAYGIFIFQDALARLLILGVGDLTLLVTLLVLRRGALTPRLVVRVCDDQTPRASASYAVADNGAPLEVQTLVNGKVTLRGATNPLPLFSTVRSLAFGLPVALAREMKIWLYQITPEGNIVQLRGRAQLTVGGQARTVELNANAAGTTLSLQDTATALDITLDKLDT